MSFLRIFEHLLPDGAAWRLTVKKRLRDFFDGLTGLTDARAFIDDVHEDLYPDTTRELEQWEAQFALLGLGSDAVRRKALAAAWQAAGGQSPKYLQDVVQAAGFDLYVHEWWSSGPPFVARDPRDHTTQPRIGTKRCSAFPSQPTCSAFLSGPRCNAFLANDPGYLVNLDLTRRAPPPVPDDPDTWPYFLYFGGETFGTRVEIDDQRRAELEALLLRICPAQQWIVLLVDYVTIAGLNWTLAEDPSSDWTLAEDPSTPWTTA